MHSGIVTPVTSLRAHYMHPPHVLGPAPVVHPDTNILLYLPLTDVHEYGRGRQRVTDVHVSPLFSASNADLTSKEAHSYP